MRIGFMVFEKGISVMQFSIHSKTQSATWAITSGISTTSR
jgi:hypothetical protein